MFSSSFAPGKIILSGEYAVVFGYPGIAVPSPLGISVQWTPAKEGGLEIRWEGNSDDRDNVYVRKVIELCDVTDGTLSIQSTLPIGKGMGSSTALVITIVRCLLDESKSVAGSHNSALREKALSIEDAMNPGHSGLDFAVIWENAPVLFQKGSEPKRVELDCTFFEKAILIDTGTPNETTPELVAWMKSRKEEMNASIETIGRCTERLLSLSHQYNDVSIYGYTEELCSIIREHHRAQIALGVVTEETRHLIAEIEKIGGAAKVIGAGGRTGGSGMVLALCANPTELSRIATSHGMPTHSL